MRLVLSLALAAGSVLVIGLAAQPAKADPYRWCADYGGGGDGGGTNCYFLTLQQCQWAISGNGGSCRENGFYDGRPVDTTDQPKRAAGVARRHQSER